MNSNKSFNSYAEARAYYNIADDDICLLITDHPKSLEQIIIESPCIELLL